jgi:hypothetical protein
MFVEIPAPESKLSVVVDPLRPQRIEFASKSATWATIQPRATQALAGPRPAQDVTAMHRRGDLTDAEFASAKQRLIGT